MYRGKHSPTSPSLNESMHNQSVVTDTATENLQREVDNYTRKLEQEKRKFFRIQQNHRQILKEYNTKVEELELLKSKKFKTEMVSLNSKSSTLQNNLDKAISSFNQALSRSNTLKAQIDELRKQRKNSNQVHKILQQKINQLKANIKLKQNEINNKKNHVSQLKSKIIQVKLQNQDQTIQYQQQINTINKKFEPSNNKNNKTNNIQINQNNDTVDTHPIIKLRLKNLLLKNKQKIKLLQQYKKNIIIIYNSFQQIKQQSGINNLQQLTKNILKQQQQQLFIYHYIDKLNKNLNFINQGNQQLKNQIYFQQSINQKYRLLLSGTPQAQKRKIQQKQFIQMKNKPIKQLCLFLQEIQENIQKIIPIGNQTLNVQNIQYFLGQIQFLINKKLTNQQTNNQIHHEQVTKYSKLVPTVSYEQLKDKQQDKLIDREKLRQYASQFWQRKKNRSKGIQQ